MVKSPLPVAWRTMSGMTQPHSAGDAVLTRDGRPLELSRDDKLRRYLARVGGADAAIAEYLLTDELVIFTHTLTEPAFEGQGVASRLVAWALADVRESARQVLPVCAFVKGYIARHAEEYGDLVYHADPVAAQEISLHESAEELPAAG